ncbi:MAG TPA: PAS domain S-box protein, partial [Thioploca sp.]|nr:PAS domain S-box protein [Thioploca sp.]
MTTSTIQAPKVHEVTMTYFDGTRRTAIVTDIETPFPTGRHVISHSDTSGIITYVNQFLIDICGYKESELLGQPHHILRHPDMPAVIFEQMWKTLQKGHIWHGAVKNLRKDGGFYWVDATVTPTKRDDQLTGFISVRSQLSREKRQE